MDDTPFATPHAAPLYPPGPYRSVDCRRVRVFAKASTTAMRRHLPAMFEPIGDTIELFFMETHDATPLPPYRAAGIVVPCRYGEIVGSHIVCEYVTTDVALAMAREVWGYPKKMASITFDERDEGVEGRVERGGVRLMEFVFHYGGPEPQRPQVMPRLQHKIIPRADGEGADVDQIVLNTVDAQEVRVQRPGTAHVTLRDAPQDPWADFGPLSVTGAEFLIADFSVGYCRIVHDRLRS
jgi:acetoacetate decarboxylase